MTLRLKASEARKLAEKLGEPVKRKRKGAKVDVQVSREAFYAMCEAHGLPEPWPEFKFHKSRDWKIDWAFVANGKEMGPKKIALEIQGALHTGGRHTRGAALEKEYEKLNELNLAGWVVLLVTPQQVQSGEAFALVARAMSSG